MDLIQKAVVRYKDKFNVTIREIKSRNDKPIIEVSQDKTLDGHYFSANELRDIVTSLFASVHDDFHIGAIPYIPLAHDVVDDKWLKKQLADHQMKLKDLAKSLGISKKKMADHHNGNVAMSNEEMAMYYYYFESRGV